MSHHHGRIRWNVPMKDFNVRSADGLKFKCGVVVDSKFKLYTDRTSVGIWDVGCWMQRMQTPPRHHNSSIIMAGDARSERRTHKGRRRSVWDLCLVGAAVVVVQRLSLWDDIVLAEEAVPAASQEAPAIHLVFSTGCSDYQDWQSYLLFHSTLAVQQDGMVTRIASGRTEAQQEELQKRFDATIHTMSPSHFRLHFTPDYTHLLEGVEYNPFNKALGLLHWLRHALDDNIDLYADTAFVVLDPDQVLLRPFVRDYSDQNELWELPEGPRGLGQGQPMAQRYRLDPNFPQWINTTGLVNVNQLNATDLESLFMVGPPYMALGADFWPLVEGWARWVGPVHERSGQFSMSEMYAYILAALQRNLSHTVGHSFMVSKPGLKGEGWPLLLDAAAPTLPHTIHYCQPYKLGPYAFGKRRLPTNIFSCEHPLMVQPSENVHELYSWVQDPTVEVPAVSRRQQAFLLVHMAQRINEAATYYKQHHCGPEANWERSYMLSGAPIPADAV